MNEWRFSVDGGKAKWREFVYRVPVMQPVKCERQFWEMSNEEKQTRYSMVVDGWKTEPPLPEHKEQADVLVRQRTENMRDMPGAIEHVQVWMLANKYTQARQPCMVHAFSITHSKHTSVDNQIVACVKSAVALTRRTKN